ncbi:MAG TPA: hypothetical protein VJ779_19310 [Acetobacteraceae bacterium]|jgi:hypothetical protein|nr:hypothetical protein [Acetobacteraceae bacterium]
MRNDRSRGRVWRCAALALGVVAFAAVATPIPAQARVGVFLGLGPFWGPPAYYYPPPFYYPPPVYYAPPPPVYYTPPPVTYTPPAYVGPGSTVRSCYAGAYVCPLETRLAAGTTCWCPDNRGGRAYGRAG